MKKILYYTDTPQTGGAESQLLLLAKFLDKEQFEAVIVCSKYKSLDNFAHKCEVEGLKVYRLNVIHKHDPRHYFELKKIIKAESPDIIHIQIWNPACARYAFMALSDGKIPIVTTEHDPFKLSYAKTLIKKRSFKKISKIICVSEENKKLMTGLYPEMKNKLTVVHNGIDTTLWRSQLLRFTEEDRKKIKEDTFKAKNDTLIVLTVAELHKRKGQDFLIKAIPEIIQTYPNVKFVFAGDGHEKENYQKLIKKLHIENNVILLGKMNNIAEIYKSSDIFVLSSIREAFGLVNVEAMLTPLPVIATMVGGIPEIVEDKTTGILVPSKNTKALKDAILKLIKYPEIRLKMAERGFIRAIEKFDVKIMSKHYEEIYTKILKND